MKFLFIILLFLLVVSTSFSQVKYPDGTMFPDGKDELDKLPEGYTAIACWCQCVTSKPDQPTSTEAVVTIDYIKTYAVNRTTGKIKIAQSQEFDNLDIFWGHLYNREPKWFAGVDGEPKPMDNYELQNSTMRLDVNKHPNKITHFGVSVVRANNDYEYIVEARVKVKGKAFVNIGLDAWINNHAEPCGEDKCNILMKYGKWYGDTNDEWIIIRTDEL